MRRIATTLCGVLFAALCLAVLGCRVAAEGRTVVGAEMTNSFKWVTESGSRPESRYRLSVPILDRLVSWLTGQPVPELRPIATATERHETVQPPQPPPTLTLAEPNDGPTRPSTGGS